MSATVRPAAPRPAVPDGGADWAALRDELDRWAAADRVATFWWRDDDATEPTPALERLLAATASKAIPLALAVIPAGATQALADRLASAPAVTVLQHGWDHRNRAQPDDKKTELGDDRPVAAVMHDLDRGRDRLRALFADRFCADVIVPPWNRIGPRIAAALAERGVALSLYGGRPAGASGRLDSHADVIAWKTGGGFVGETTALSRIVDHLAARRTGAADPREATGLLTHHLVHDAATWAFLDRLAALIAKHPAAAWRDVATALADGRREAAA
jgi:hypothetical protein